MLNDQIDESDATSIETAVIVNTLFPSRLSILTKRYDTKVIQISTDGVFAPDAGLCAENTPSNCNDVYGVIKALAKNVEMYELANIHVSSLHKCYWNGVWKNVKNISSSRNIKFKGEFVYCLITKKNIIQINNLIFSDFLDVNYSNFNYNIF